jgi:hypothetical protein
MEEHEQTVEVNPRRQVLRWLALVSLGGGITALGLGALLRTDASADAEEPRTASTKPTPVETVVNGQQSTMRIKVVYFQMPQAVSVGQEYFDLQSPARVSDLMRAATQRHPALSEMAGQMLILVEGVPASGTTGLENGDEVDLIPTLVGG